MKALEGFGACLKRILKEQHMSASEAARLTGSRSRNSVFRILQGSTSPEVSGRFLRSLEQAVGDAWPVAVWQELHRALAVDRSGPEKYQSNAQFLRLLCAPAPAREDVLVQTESESGEPIALQPLREVMAELLSAPRTEIILTGCCEAGLMHLLANCCESAGGAGTLTVRHYIDVTESLAVSNLMNVLPLAVKSWYNARLVGTESCTEQARQLYRQHAIYINCTAPDGSIAGHQLVGVDEGLFIRWQWGCACPPVRVLDRWRFHLDLLKPILPLGGSAEDFLNYTEQYARLEEDCIILSIKPDVHFNCIPADLLEASILEGFERAGIAQGEDLRALVAALKDVHIRRNHNTFTKRRATHLVYSLPAMERFMRTGVLSDHFFLQRAYTVDERREILRTLRDTMQDKPWFEIRFLRAEFPDLQHEITYYGGKGVMLLNAYTDYDLEGDHSEAMITLPVFMERFYEFFMDKLLAECVLSRAETLRELERLLRMAEQLQA